MSITTRIHSSLHKTEFKITEMLVGDRRIVIVSMHGVSVVLLLYSPSVHVNKNCNSHYAYSNLLYSMWVATDSEYSPCSEAVMESCSS